MILIKKRFVSEVWSLEGKGHDKFEFVDVALNTDNLLFIDPCLIENCNSEWAERMKLTMGSFFRKFYSAYRNDDKFLKHSLLSHAREQNATRLGYGRGDNGKGNTAKGLIHSFRPLETLIHDIDTIGIAQDTTVLIPGFAEDGLSDLLTNVIHKELSDFTLFQMKKYGIQANNTTSFHTWDEGISNWVEIEAPCYKYGNDEILLVPKNIVRKNYLFSVEQYFKRIILERKREEDGWRDDKGKLISKQEIEMQLRTDDKHWKYEYVIDYTKLNSDALAEYHKKLPLFYAEYGQPIENDILDEIIYSEVMACA